MELGRLHLHPFQLYLLALWRPPRDPPLACIRPIIVPTLSWWLDESRFLRRIPLSPPQPTLFLTTDASLEGWGVHLEPLDLITSGLWSVQEFN